MHEITISSIINLGVNCARFYRFVRPKEKHGRTLPYHILLWGVTRRIRNNKSVFDNNIIPQLILQDQLGLQKNNAYIKAVEEKQDPTVFSNMFTQRRGLWILNVNVTSFGISRYSYFTNSLR